VTTSLRASLQERLNSLFASHPEELIDPYPVYRELAESGPVVAWGPTMLVTRYADVKPLLRDGVRYGNGYRAQGTLHEHTRSQLAGAYRDALDEVTWFEAMYMSRADGDVHKRLREIAHRAFTPRRIAELGEATQRYVDDILDDCAGEPVTDLMTLAYWVPLMIIGDLLGVPAGARESIHDWSGKIGRNRGGTEAEPLMEARDALQAFRGYVDGVIAEHRGTPTVSDLVSALMTAEGGDRLSPDELAAMFIVLLFAGHETTTNLIANGMLGLLHQRDQWERLCADPTLAGGAADELLRHVSPVQLLGRLALVDVEIAGTTIPAGQAIRPMLVCANRDPRVFDDPDRIDITRRNARDHVALGFGPHYCLGASLARLEGQIALATLARRFPKIELAADGLEWTGNASLRRPTRMPVSLGPDHAPPSP
jgi:cytochrome P450